MTLKRQIRRAQTVSPFGVGGIYDFGNESFAAADISHWRSRGEQIRLMRLERALGVSRFLMAPVPRGIFDTNPRKIPYVRFPSWLFCPICRRMVRLRQSDETGEVPRCRTCRTSPKLVPMRFVTICENGHMSDVPWDRWAHSKSESPRQRQCGNKNLRFISHGERGGGLDSLEVQCATCRAKRSLQRITSPGSIRGIGLRCSGIQPWQRTDQGTVCGEDPVVVQRGASNVYYAKVVSALDISSDEVGRQDDEISIRITNHALFGALKSLAASQEGYLEDDTFSRLAGMVADQTGTSMEEIIRVIQGEQAGGQRVRNQESIDSLLAEEWRALVNPPRDSRPGDAFIASYADTDSYLEQIGERQNPPLTSLLGLVDSVVLVTRLREVRALEGFQRRTPERLVRADLGRGLDWLPGVEVYGEGIFITLNEQRLLEWETASETFLKRRIGGMLQRYQNSSLSFLPAPDARIVLLHTFSHILIRQLSFECGYSASSLRERIFAAQPGVPGGPMAGILIYTADSDSEGSLGGLVRQGQPERLFPLMLAALQRSTWCSSDPICREVQGQGLHGLNRAACHACTLVSETSCVYSNVFLDRMLLVDESTDGFGFFDPVLNGFRNSYK